MIYKGYFIDYVQHLDTFRITKLGNPYDALATLDGEEYQTFTAVEKYIDEHLIG